MLLDDKLKEIRDRIAKHMVVNDTTVVVVTARELGDMLDEIKRLHEFIDHAGKLDDEDAVREVTIEECNARANEMAVLLGYKDHQEAWEAEGRELSRTIAGTEILMKRHLLGLS